MTYKYVYGSPSPGKGFSYQHFTAYSVTLEQPGSEFGVKSLLHCVVICAVLVKCKVARFFAPTFTCRVQILKYYCIAKFRRSHQPNLFMKDYTGRESYTKARLVIGGAALKLPKPGDELTVAEAFYFLDSQRAMIVYHTNSTVIGLVFKLLCSQTKKKYVHIKTVKSDKYAGNGILKFVKSPPLIGKWGADAVFITIGVVGKRRRWSFIYVSGKEHLGNVQKEHDQYFSTVKKLLFTPAKNGAYCCQMMTSQSGRSVSLIFEIAYYDVIIRLLGNGESVLFVKHRQLAIRPLSESESYCSNMFIHEGTAIIIGLHRYYRKLQIIRYWPNGRIFSDLLLERPGRLYGSLWTVLDETRQRVVVVSALGVILEMWWSEGQIKFAEFRCRLQKRQLTRKRLSFFIDEDAWLLWWSLGDQQSFQAYLPV
ncbi:uncharacterized protein LOC135492087 isoform X1 [Lineus longissimus]|uniref:uncharacterized protein LOC135492087 isoform X1 n=1 Tax=Lineus longissimus TaxID=88925 RepID=UPI002B4F70E2